MIALIIDDDMNNAEILRDLLHLQKVDSTILSDGTNVTSILEQQDNWSMIFLDLSMPDIDGFTVLEQIQDLPAIQSVPIVAYSIYRERAGEARKRGFHSFLSKPINQHKFSAYTQSILSGDAIWDV